ncbi:uncharacterized protein BJ212DRAFT_1488544 [Suillus subaureus]|uniref:Uncharacterized protein n=1 Tax=Suillus subaureus TaxID=48587 RepID=A0A9P7J0E9_9AGAM|nr:uncharacterized protein BJ212DRAFT_1488544 [Suillus subaureus]KAG1798720.1 hypothetical protein BJ212DRAFT_1488544 [Suillus subaureus]
MPSLSAKAWEKKHSRKRSNGTILRRNPGRGDGSTWKGRGYICAAAVDGCSVDNVHDAEEYDVSEAFPPVPFSTTFSLFDGAQFLPSKRQRKAKSRPGDFEILDSNPKVIPINDNSGSDTDEDEWEKVDVSDISGRRRMKYSRA